MNTMRERLIAALESAADALDRGERYEWGHVGRCAVGHVVQRLALMSDREIFAAFERTVGQWREHAAEYFDAAVGDEPLAATESQREWCATAGTPLAEIYRLFHAAGVDSAAIGHMEFLSDPRVLAEIPPPKRWKLRRSDPHDAALYLRTYARVLAAERSSTSTPKHCSESA
ncbi:MAG: hypothetical protein AA908_08565 [Chlorobi bacterium NICIL-2]|nr:MAG: hypothetical protein AA908_08565 [Chlorobi bacterium NICIL-2]